VNHLWLAFVKALSGCADHIGHLNRWPRHLLRIGARANIGRAFQRAGCSADMPLRHMDIDRGLLQIAVAEENLDGAQVSAGLSRWVAKQ